MNLILGTVASYICLKLYVCKYISNNKQNNNWKMRQKWIIDNHYFSLGCLEAVQNHYSLNNTSCTIRKKTIKTKHISDDIFCNLCCHCRLQKVILSLLVIVLICLSCLHFKSLACLDRLFKRPFENICAFKQPFKQPGNMYVLIIKS